MDNELFELCKEVYKRTGWNVGTAHDYIYQSYRTKAYISVDEYQEVDDDYYEAISPLYTSDYLLEKLPKFVNMMNQSLVEGFLVLDRPKSMKYSYRAFYTAPSYGKKYVSTDDSPIKALLRLVIVLDKAGELK